MSAGDRPITMKGLDRDLGMGSRAPHRRLRGLHVRLRGVDGHQDSNLLIHNKLRSIDESPPRHNLVPGPLGRPIWFGSREGSSGGATCAHGR